ncbi:hypothetical protein AMECASPLE_022881 [Ameca splendens]|uniref:Uncharacterized protein n=1 Tax=Ameca splendens TaxID=208324 RepID=A0ABV0YFK7_9TELE
MPERLQASTRLWINRIYSPAGCYLAFSTTNLFQRTLFTLHHTPRPTPDTDIAEPSFVSQDQETKATFRPTFVVQSCFQFPALLSSWQFPFQTYWRVS